MLICQCLMSELWMTNKLLTGPPELLIHTSSAITPTLFNYDMNSDMNMFIKPSDNRPYALVSHT